MSSIFGLAACHGAFGGLDRRAARRCWRNSSVQGLIRHIGLSNVTPAQLAEAQKITEIVCVQNLYNVAHRKDDKFIDDLAAQGIAYVPFFPLGGFTPLQSSALEAAAVDASHAHAGCARLAAAALAEHPADSRNIFGRPSSREPSGGRPGNSR